MSICTARHTPGTSFNIYNTIKSIKFILDHVVRGSPPDHTTYEQNNEIKANVHKIHDFLQMKPRN